jgi:hypothetical protein
VRSRDCQRGHLGQPGEIRLPPQSRFSPTRTLAALVAKPGTREEELTRLGKTDDGGVSPSRCNSEQQPHAEGRCNCAAPKNYTTTKEHRTPKTRPTTGWSRRGVPD